MSRWIALGVFCLSAMGCPSGQEFRAVDGLRWNGCVLELCVTQGASQRCVPCDGLSSGVFGGTGPSSCSVDELASYTYEPVPPAVPAGCGELDGEGTEVTQDVDVGETDTTADDGPELGPDVTESDLPFDGDSVRADDGAVESDGDANDTTDLPDTPGPDGSDVQGDGDASEIPLSCPSDCADLAPACQTGLCLAGECVFENAADGTTCDDGDLCTTNDSCFAGACQPGNAVTCDASEACVASASCDSTTGLCVETSAPDETSCGVFGAPAFCTSGQCWPRRVTAGSNFMCLLAAGDVVCWGHNADGQLGRGHTNYVGDDEVVWQDSQQLSGKGIVHLDAGTEHVCAVTLAGEVRCWGKGLNGQLGLGNPDNLGDDEGGFSVAPIDLGPGSQVEAAYAFLRSSCALQGGELRCWGANDQGMVGSGTQVVLGDDESPANATVTPLGGLIDRLYPGIGPQACVRLVDGTHRCWGSTPYLLGDSEVVFGDDETAAGGPLVDAGVSVTQLSSGFTHGCARDTSGWLRCFGYIAQVGLGYGDGTQSAIAPLEDLPILGGVLSKSVATGMLGTCAILQDDTVQCWGAWSDAAGGLSISGFESPAWQAPIWEFPSKPQQVAVGNRIGCGVLADGSIMCWGSNDNGQLGLGHTDPVAGTPAQGPILLPWK